jgi:membrane associated rhomboid family serine protease
MERVLGPRRLVVVLAASGLAGATASALLHAPEYISVGASTMAYGLVGLMVVVHRRLGHAVPVECRPSPRGLAAIPLVELSMWALVPNTDGWAHVGGLLGGLVAAAWVVPNAESFGREVAALALTNSATTHQDRRRS